MTWFLMVFHHGVGGNCLDKAQAHAGELCFHAKVFNGEVKEKLWLLKQSWLQALESLLTLNSDGKIKEGNSDWEFTYSQHGRWTCVANLPPSGMLLVHASKIQFFLFQADSSTWASQVDQALFSIGLTWAGYYNAPYIVIDYDQVFIYQHIHQLHG